MIKLIDLLKENVMQNKDAIIKFITTNSYFEYDQDNYGQLIFSTRKNGSVSNETASSIDINEAKQVISKLLKTFKGIKAEWETVDEWVSITVYDA